MVVNLMLLKECTQQFSVSYGSGVLPFSSCLCASGVSLYSDAPTALCCRVISWRALVLCGQTQLLPDCVHFSCCYLIASVPAATTRLCSLHSWYSPIASACDHMQVVQSIVCTKAVLMMNYLDSEWLKVAPTNLGGMSPDPQYSVLCKLQPCLPKLSSCSTTHVCQFLGN